jgi:Tfp pilus assembly protein PilO
MEIDKPIAIFIILIVIVILTTFLIIPKEKELKNLQKTTAEKQAELEAKSEYFFKVENLWEDLNRREEQLKKIDTIIPDKIDLSSLVYFLERSASQSGVVLESISLKNFSFLQGETKMKIRTSYFNIRIVGTYPAFKNFLSILENSARLIEVENISFGKKTEGGGTQDISLTIKVYSL